MKIGFVHSVHGGDEPLSGMLGQSLEDNPVENVFPFEANPLANELGLRYVQENFAASTKFADAESDIYERRRAAAALDWCKDNKFDFVIDWHTTPYPGGESANIHLKTNKSTLRLINFFCMQDVVVGEYGLQEQLSNVISIDVGDTGKVPRGYTIRHWRRMLGELAAFEDMDHFMDGYVASVDPSDIRYWQYGDGIYVPKLVRPAFAENNVYTGSMFQALTEEDKLDLNLEGLPYKPTAYSMNMGSKDLPNGWIGEFVFRLPQHAPYRADYEEIYRMNRALIQQAVARGLQDDRRILQPQ
jgi:hypothetical protein